MSVIEQREVRPSALTVPSAAPPPPPPPAPRSPSPPEPGLTTPALALRMPWLGWILPAAMLALLLVLSPSFAEGEFLATTATLGLTLAFTVGPTVLRAHVWVRRPAAGEALQASSSSSWLLIGLAVLLAPTLALVVGLPPLAAAILGIQAWPAAIVLAAERSDRLGRGCCCEVVRSVLVEAGLLLVLGMLLGGTAGPTGVVIAMLVASVGGGVELYRSRPACPTPERVVPDRHAAYGVAALALLAVSTQADLVAAPEVLGVAEADSFTVAAFAGKAIFVGLIAAGAGVLAIAATEDARVTRKVGRILLLGSGLTVVAASATPLIGLLLDRPSPAPTSVILPAVAMTLAAANWVATLGLLVRGARALVVPLTIVLAFGLLLLLAPPPVLSLEAAMAVAQAGGLLVALVMVHRSRIRHEPGPVSRDTERLSLEDQTVVDLSTVEESSRTTMAAR